jgi:CHAT domain-containing protein/tetratricopeptide (TPR) repeat protein
MDVFNSTLLENFDVLFPTLSPQDTRSRSTLCGHYAILKVAIFERSGRIEDLDDAITKGKLSIDGTLGDDRALHIQLNNLAIMLGRRYDETRQISDLEEAIYLSRRAVRGVPRYHIERASTLSNLGNRLSRLYKETGNLQVLEEAIHFARQAVDSAPTSHQQYALLVHNLMNKLALRSKYSRRPEDLDEGLQVALRLVKITPEASSQQLDALQFVGALLLRRFEYTGQLNVLEEATHIARRVRIATADRSPDFAARLCNLANCLYRRSEYFAEKDDVEEAVGLMRHAILLTSKQDYSMLSNFLPMLHLLCKLSGDTKCLEEATDIARQALRQTPYDHKSLGGLMNGLGQILQLRFHISGDTNDLEEAMQLMREALERTQQDCTDFSEISTDLVATLQFRYMRSRDGKDLEEAIIVARKAIEILPQEYRNFATMLSNLSDLLGSKFEREKDIELLDEAIQIQRRAIGLAPRGYPHTGTLLNRLGRQLRYRYEYTKDSQDLDQAIQAAREALKATKETHHNYSFVLKDLGVILLYRYGRSEELKDLKEVIHVLEQVWSCKNGIPFVRIITCNMLVLLLHLDHDYDRAFDLAVEAINMLPYVHKRSLNQQDQQYVVSHFFGLAPIACSIALHKGEGPDTALELLERGRGLILGLLMEDRRNIQALEVAHPKLYARYESLRIEVNKPAEGYSNCLDRNEALSSQMSDMKKVDECVQEIRKLPGFDKFHERSTAKQMQDCASDGDIIVVNVTKLRSDAIVVTARGTRTISFPKLSADDARSWNAQDLTTTSMTDRKAGQKNKVYRQFLSWLWQHCVKPIMEELHYDAQASIDSLPRIWWIGTGFANNFPFHAAGDSSGNVGQHAISSYTPTIRALRYARERSVATAPSSGIQKALIVTMPDTPGMNKLPRSIVEAQDIAAVMETVVDVEVVERPSVATTLSKLQGCSIAHFACHGLSYEQSPGASGLILQREDKESSIPRQDMLTTQILSRLELSQAEIAFLSACYTADGRAVLLSDEMLHVVGGFQTAGFRHVIGCLWPSKDRVCSAVAKAFYAELYRDGVKGRNRDKAVALALHKAVQQVRDSEKLHNRPLSWAQYVHFGA